MPQRKQHSAQFKAKVAFEVIKGEKTANQISSDHGIHPAQLAQWKKQLVDGSPSLFTDKRAKSTLDKDALDEDALKARLYQQIGQLQVELDWLKKKSG